jgi:hypothetical protein
MWIDDLVTLLTDAGVASLGEDLTTSSKATLPALASGAVISIISTGGTSPEYTHTTRTSDGQVTAVKTRAYERPSAIIISRAKNSGPALDAAWAAYNAVDGIRNEFINSGFYQAIHHQQSEPIDAGVDDKGFQRYTFNVIGIKRPS